MIQFILTILSTISLICGRLIFNQRHRLLSSQNRIIHSNEVTIIIPARNEERRLPHLLQSLQGQQGIYEVIVMDDGSKDNTKEIAQTFGATVYEIEQNLDRQWFGKSHACYQGATNAQSELLMFVDADVTFGHPHAIEKILNTYRKQHNHGLLSVQPFHEPGKFYGSLSAIFNLMTVVGVNQFSSLARQSNNDIAFGPVTLMHRDDYFKTDGHKNAQYSIIEGFALGEKFESVQLPVTVYEGGNDVKFRMYEAGIQSLIQGWTKHFSVGADKTQPQIMLAIVMWLMGSITSTLTLLISVFTKPASRIVSFLFYVLYTSQFVRLHLRVGAFSMVLLILHPVLFIFFIFIFANSWRHTHFSKKVEWKGRSFKIN